MKTTFAILTAICLAAGSRGAWGQEPFPSPMGDDMGSLPEAGTLEMPGEEILSEPIEEGSAQPVPMAEDGSLMTEFDPSGACDVGDMYGAAPLFESSGSWLARGYWYGEADYCLLGRQWDRHGLLLMFERGQGTFPDFNNPQVNSGVIVVTNQLRAQGGEPSENGLARVTMGRFLFRDGRNRDHLTQVTWLGGGGFNQSNRLAATTAAGLLSSDLISTVSRGFDGATASNFDYSNNIQSLEWNYVVRQRMRRDQLMLQPNGEWVRAATPSKTFSFLAGARLMGVDETLDWRAPRINVGTAAAPNNRDGDFFNNTKTDNTLLGTQIGGSGSYETARWSITASTKAGPYWNNERLRESFLAPDTATPTTDSSANTAIRGDSLAFVAEADLIARWHLRPNVSLRAGVEVLHVTGISLAPHQLDFVPGGQTAIADTGYSTYIGSVLGLEWYR